MTAIALLLFGGVKAFYTVCALPVVSSLATPDIAALQGSGSRVTGVIYGAISTLAIGASAAAASYGVVKALNANNST